ncbi:tubulin polyglutamylase TTLL11-like [Babylonia areolata]|uniref:tubulin polyglutamylase TTLL11-like n=1 Tax=Babylonia areolata TaxID=304850 RepID=UPI003FCF8F18
MLNKRQQLQQQQLIYGGSNTILPLRGIRSELLKHTDSTPKLKHSESKRQLKEKQSNSSQSPQRNSAPSQIQKTGDGKSGSQRPPDLKVFLSSPNRPTDGKGDGVKVVGKEAKPIGRTRRSRPSVYIPPIHYGERHYPRNIVTIDTSKARGNTDVVRLVARDLGWREVPVPRRDHNCDVIWNAISFHDQPDVYSGQVNKFPGAQEVFHKVALFRQLMLMKQLFPEDFTFFPRTWLLPAQYHEFANDVRQLNESRSSSGGSGKTKPPKPTFIVKPSEGSQGEGIYLLREPQNYSPQVNRSHVAQEYLNNVLLIDGFKFDLRVYVVVRRLDPLEIHICNEGLARFSTIPYESPTNKNLHETFMHLTNYSLNKRSSTFNKSDKEDEGSKRKMTSVFHRMERMGLETAKLWKEIEGIVCKTMIAVAGELKVEYQAALPTGKPQPSCFQVLGFDILILKDLMPILLEVNSNPSLSITGEQEVSPGVVEYLPSIKDEEVKRSLIRDTLIMVAPKNKYTRKRRRRWRRPQRCVEEMEVDSPSSPPTTETRHRNQRERDITIRFEDAPASDGQKSIFAENDKMRPSYQRQETCRVFVEGEGEITRFDTPPYYHHQQKDQNANNSQSGTGTDNKNENNNMSGNDNKNGNDDNKSGSNNKNRHHPRSHSEGRRTGPGPIKDSLFLDSKDPQSSSIFQKNKTDKPAEAFMEEDGPSLQPLPYELTIVESSEDENEEEEQSCLKEIFPAVYAEELRPLRLLERLADIFMGCLSVRGCIRLGPTAFRMFARKCRLNRKGLNNASIDILYIDMQRKWEFLNPDRTSGLCFQGFVDACMEIARRKFSSSRPADTLETLITYCEDSVRAVTLRSEDDGDPKRERISPRILRPQRRSVNLFPRRTITSLEEETVQDLFRSAMQKRGGERSSGVVSEVNNFMRDMRHRSYVPSVFTGLDNQGEE